MGEVLPFSGGADTAISADRAIEIIRSADPAAWPLLYAEAQKPESPARQVIDSCNGLRAVERLFAPVSKKTKWKRRKIVWDSFGQFVHTTGDQNRFLHMAGKFDLKLELLRNAARGMPTFFGIIYPATDEEREWMLDLEQRVLALLSDEKQASVEQAAVARERDRIRKEEELVRDTQAAEALVREAKALKGTKFHRFVIKLADAHDRPSRLATKALGQETIDAARAWHEAEREKTRIQRQALKERKEKEAEVEGRSAAAPASRHLEVEHGAAGFAVRYRAPEPLTLGSPTRAREARYRVSSRLTARLVADKRESGDLFEATVAHANYRRLADAVEAIDASLDSFAGEPMTPQIVEEILGISAPERLTWTKDGRLPTCGTAGFTKGRVTITYALHPANRIAAMKCDPAIVAAWRNDDAAESAASRKRGAKQAAQTRVENEAHRKSARDEVEAMARDAARQVGSPIAVPLVRLAILATMCSRWAKRRQERKDFDGKERFYELKDRALKVFATQPWTTVRYFPGRSPKVDVHLCDDHHDDFREARRALGYNFWGWVEDNRKWIRKCPHCSYSEDRDYYALYDMELAIGDARFSWHVPYSLGHEWLPPREGLEVVRRNIDPDDEPYEGAFLFGRPVTEWEEILWPADRLVREIEAVLNLFEKQLSPGAGAASLLETLN